MNNIHIMSPDELESLPDGAVIWEEYRDYKVPLNRVQPMVKFHGMFANYYDYLYPDELRADSDIQLKIRYWSHRPTIETMAREPWIIREEWKD